MAYFEDKFCSACQKDQAHTNGKCGICEAKESAAKLKEWTDQTLEAKLLDLHHRVLGLEHPPTFS